MKESISIKNLGPVKEINIEEIKPLTVFIGESGSGKSTIMKAISLFRWIYKMHNIRSYLKRSKVLNTPFRFRMDTYFKNCGFEQFINKNTEIIYTVKTEENSYELKFANSKLSGNTDKNLIQKEDIQYSKISFISENRNIIPLWADRGAALAGGYLGFYFHEVFNDFDKASDAIKEFKANYLNVVFSVSKEQFKKRYYISSPDKLFKIDFKNSSSGTQNAIPISLITEHFSKYFDFEEAFNQSMLGFLSKTKNFTDFRPIKNLEEVAKKMYIHIEEPELSLYPDAQISLLNSLIKQCFIENTNNINLIFSTHSPYIINQLNPLIKARDTEKTIEGAYLKYEDVAAFMVVDGELENLMLLNHRLINTNPLSDSINSIYDRYQNL